MSSNKLVSCLWFDKQAEEAANFYVSVFKDAQLGTVTKYGNEGYDEHGMKEGTVMTADFTINGQQFVALNGGPAFKFNEAISFQIMCDNQQEIDYYWDKLTADGGEESQCGWLKDKYGLSWQVVPTMLIKLLKDPSRRDRVMHVFMKMKKFNIAELERA